MEGESLETIEQRFCVLLFYQLATSMPRPGANHIYSKGKMYSNFKMDKTANGHKFVMSSGVKYSHYAMGFRDDGSKRTPRGQLEAYNFQTIERCINEIAQITARGNEGMVTHD